MRFFWILIGAFVLVVLLAVAFLGLNRPTSTTPRSSNKAVVLTDYAGSDATVGYTIEGAINSNEAHRLIKIAVGQNSRTIEVVAGYQGDVIKSETLDNNSSAYKAFLAALQTAGFIQQRPKLANKDVQGQCSFGNKYYYIANGINGLSGFLWSVSCPKILGTFNGSQPDVQRLFQSQIPDYSKFVSGVVLQ